MLRISVIVPVYNTCSYLSKCLESLFSQTLCDIEIICVDDGSTDGSSDVLRDFAQKDSRLKVLKHERNKGAAAARNTGLAVARGEYLGFVDSDDYVSNDYFEKLYIVAKENTADIAKARYFYEKKDDIQKEDKYNISIEENKYNFSINFTTAIYRHSIIKNNKIRFPDGITNYEDVVFLIMCVCCANKIKTIDSVYYHYIKRTCSSTSKDYKKIFDMTLQACFEIVFILNKTKIPYNNYNKLFRQCINVLLSISVTPSDISENSAYKVIKLLENYKFLPQKIKKSKLPYTKRSVVEIFWDIRRISAAPFFPKNDQKFIYTLYKMSHFISICLFISTLAPGGAERQIVTLAKALARKGVVVYLVYYESKGNCGHYLGMLKNTYVIHFSYALNNTVVSGSSFCRKYQDLYHEIRAMGLPPLSILALTGALTFISPDILHCYLDGNNILGGSVGILGKVPGIVLSFRSVDPATAQEVYTDMALKYYTFLLRYNNVALEANSNCGAYSYAHWLRIDIDRIVVNPNGIDSSLLNREKFSSRQIARRSLGIDESIPIVLFLGRYHACKCPDVLLSVADELRKKIPSVLFLVAGDGMQHDAEIGFLLQQYKLTDNIRLLGPRKDVLNLLIAADVLLMTSKIEGFPNVVMEAMSAGRPVVATRVGAIPELVREGKDGFLHNVGDVVGLCESLQFLLSDSKTRNRMGQNAKQRILEDFTSDRLAQRALLQYSSLLGQCQDEKEQV